MNRTVQTAKQVHGSDPQHLIPKILRERIYASKFWQQHLMGFPLEPCIDLMCTRLRFVGGCIANQRPSPFLCCLLKLLQLGQDGDNNMLVSSENKYALCLGLFLVRLTLNDVQVYTKLEPFLNDRRRLKWRKPDGTFAIIHVDEVVEQLLGYEGGTVFEVPLPRLKERHVLVRQGVLSARVSVLDGTTITVLPSDTFGPVQVQTQKVKKKEKWRI